MKRLLLLLAVILMAGCTGKKNENAMSSISDITIQKTENTLIMMYPDHESDLIKKGVSQAASLWTEKDGTNEEFMKFSVDNFMPDAEAKENLFNKLSKAFETFYGTSNQVSVELQKPIHLAGDELTEIDYILGGYSPYSHLSDDLYNNKVAFITILNFPHYTLEEKNTLGNGWNRLQWAYARIGDIFTTRIPAEIEQEKGVVASECENYISSYNIMMGHILDENGEKLFPEDMVLLSHWNLRDELKSNYADIPNANRKQEAIYKIMEHIVCQTIPADVINNDKYDWNPFSNKTFCNGSEVRLDREKDVRYQQILNTFNVEKKIDRYCPQLPTALKRNFEEDMEVSQDEIRELFIKLISSPQVKKVADLIKERLGRELRPYDIWYDGFKSRSAIPEDKLTEQTRKRYPDAEAFGKDMPRMLKNLGFTAEDAEFLSDRIVVENARGSGHAWGAQGRWEPARLRTRIGKEGMDYKGYNIAVHEFGHNVEQTLDLYNIDYYILNGVPNTAFTETLAFIFQKRDLQLLGYDQKIDDNTTLDIFWGAYEIMGVALVDMGIWEWMYENPDAEAGELKKATLAIARDIWNQYYEPILGTHDSPLLAIYSHIINSPLYLANYPFGHIIEYQLENHLAKTGSRHEFAEEIKRIYTIGRITPQAWMNEAIGSNVKVDPLLEAVDQLFK